jgi:hypothetical protein
MKSILFFIFCFKGDFLQHCRLFNTALSTTPQIPLSRSFHFDVVPDLDPAPHQGDANLGSLAYSVHSLQGSILSLHASIVSVHGSFRAFVALFVSGSAFF